MPNNWATLVSAVISFDIAIHYFLLHFQKLNGNFQKGYLFFRKLYVHDSIGIPKFKSPEDGKFYIPNLGPKLDLTRTHLIPNPI